MCVTGLMMPLGNMRQILHSQERTREVVKVVGEGGTLRPPQHSHCHYHQPTHAETPIVASQAPLNQKKSSC